MIEAPPHVKLNGILHGFRLSGDPPEWTGGSQKVGGGSGDKSGIASPYPNTNNPLILFAGESRPSCRMYLFYGRENKARKSICGDILIS
jgi:hypothetical protein